MKEGDEIQVLVIDDRSFAIDRDRSREQALARIHALARPSPPGWSFDRGEANER